MVHPMSPHSARGRVSSQAQGSLPTNTQGQVRARASLIFKVEGHTDARIPYARTQRGSSAGYEVTPPPEDEGAAGVARVRDVAAQLEFESKS
jgi:hypothetical protein